MDTNLFGDELAPCSKGQPRGRQQVVFCLKCSALDSIFWGGGVTLASRRCVKCGGELSTSRGRSAKLKLYDAVMARALVLVAGAAHGSGDIDQAISYVEYAAHTAFKLQLVPYGPEPER